MLSTAVALAILTTAGFMFTYYKLPRKVRRFLEKHALLTEMTVLIGVYMLHGGTLAALLASGLCMIFVSAMLHIANHPEDFMYLYDFRDFVKNQLGMAKDVATEYGKMYRDSKKNVIEA